MRFAHVWTHHQYWEVFFSSTLLLLLLLLLLCSCYQCDFDSKIVILDEKIVKVLYFDTCVHIIYRICSCAYVIQRSICRIIWKWCLSLVVRALRCSFSVSIQQMVPMLSGKEFCFCSHLLFAGRFVFVVVVFVFVTWCMTIISFAVLIHCFVSIFFSHHRPQCHPMYCIHFDFVPSFVNLSMSLFIFRPYVNAFWHTHTSSTCTRSLGQKRA